MSSKEVLSNDQVEQLVAAAREGRPTESTKSARRPRRVREIDFSRPTKFTKDQERRIERAHEAFCRSLSLRLSGELRTEVELEVINVHQVTLASAYSDLPHSMLFCVARTLPLDTFVLLSGELKAMTGMIERLLGGVGAPSRLDRELTEIELALGARIFRSMLEELSTTWGELFGLQLEPEQVESVLANVQLAPGSEPTVAVTMEMRSGDALSATFSLIVPYRSIEAVVDRLPSGHVDGGTEAEHDDATATAVRSALAGVDVDLRVEVASVELPLADVLALRVGDVVTLGAPAASGVTVCAHDAPIHRARPGRRGKQRAIEIVERLEETP